MPDPVPPSPPFPAASSGGGSAAVVDLKPLQTGDLLDLTFRLYRHDFVKFLLLALSLYSPVFLLGAVIQYLQTRMMTVLFPGQSTVTAANIMETLKLFSLMCLMALISLLIAEACTAVMTFYGAESYLGRKPELRPSYAALRRRLPALIITTILKILILGLLLLPSFFAAMGIIVAYQAGLLLGLVLMTLLALLLLTPFLILYVRYVLSTQVVMLESLQGWKALKRSSELTRYDPGEGFWNWGETRVSLLLLLLFVVKMLVTFVSSVPAFFSHLFDISRGILSDHLISFSPVLVLTHVLGYLGNSLMAPLYALALTLFYYDVLVRREAFDLSHLARSMTAARETTGETK